VPTSDGNYVYVANRSVSGSSNGNISSYSVGTAGLTFVATAAAGPTGLLGLAEDSTGGYLLATDSAGNPDLEAYTMSSGTLTSVLSVATGTDPTGAIAVAATQ
jgi:6-phosphogluconolactonase (cycloisomerase 2 family)